MVGSKSNIVYQKGLEDDPRKRRPDISKITHDTCWEPTILLHEGLRKIIEYYKKND